MERAKRQGSTIYYLVYRDCQVLKGSSFLRFHAERRLAFARRGQAYLIARLQRLLSSTWLAVVVTTALFASYHIYQGTTVMIGTAAFGFVLALAFCWFRRLWPLCLAHALWNILLRL